MAKELTDQENIPPDDLKFTLGDPDQTLVRQMDGVALFRCRGRRADLTPFGPAGGPTSLERPSAVCRVLFGRSPLTRLQL